MQKFDPKPARPVNVRNDTVSVRLTPELKDRFFAVCDARKVKPNELLRQCIDFALSNME